MQQAIEKILAEYGSAVTLLQDGISIPVRAFFQPVRSKSWQYLEGNYSPLGEIPRGQYVYLGPASPAAKAGDSLSIGGKSYWLRRTELIQNQNIPLYCWGVCVEKGGEDTWGQS